jgi:hypothetical protein
MELQNNKVVNLASAGVSSDGLPAPASSQLAAATPTTPSTAAGPASGTTSDIVAINWSTSSFHKLYDGKMTLNSAADMVRQTNSTLVSAGKIIGNMKLQLEGIVKNNPPFPPGDAQRMNYLKSFAALRRQFEQLTFPSDSSSANVTIPALPTNPAHDTSDAPIHDTLAALGSASATINAQQQALTSGFQVTLATQAGGGVSAQSAVQNSRSIQTVLTTTSTGLSLSNNDLLKKL